MRLTAPRQYIAALTVFLALASTLAAQKRPDKKYPALLWEITGNGLRKPSYLFGTMHVSSKLVFHLSDSFYLDIKNAEVVALELDPQLWQDQLFRFQKMQTNLRFYTQGSPGDLLNEKSFQLEKYDERLKSALSDEPTVINGLLYRTYQTRADFEEDTYLDLYIYQTGKKLGKQATGVENYFQTEQLVMEAAQDMMKDKKKRSTDNDGDSPYEIEKKTQDAYRKGDLDMLDSLEKLLQPSESYMEKFLYRRNEIQANSIDSIVKRHSLFVGVGAAHLPGKRGVIEILRQKGYILRPVTMPDRDATQKDDIDKIRVPVSFSTFTADDGDFSVNLPGKLYRRTEGRSADSWQYADMSNGAYYMIGRVKTHSSFLGQKEDQILKKVDSLLYENIPGKIMKKKEIVRNGYKGYDITGKTRRGDIQRYNILVTPYEVLVFKMSGNNSYVEGKEAEQFFGSIKVRTVDPATWTEFTPPQGGFRIRLPGQPAQSRNNSNTDGMIRWEYEATDSATGDAFLVWKKTIQNYRFLEEDTTELALMEESFGMSDWVDRSLSRRTGLFKGYPCLDASYMQKDGSFLRVKYLIRGPHHYLLAARSRTRDKPFQPFFSSFEFEPFRYDAFRNYVDTFINIRVTTPMVPDIDVGMRGLIERASSEEFLNAIPDYNSYWPRNKTAMFQDDSTGEAVFVSMETFPRYYYPKDTAAFWLEEGNEKKLKQDLVLRSRQPLRFNDTALSGVNGYKYIFTDTNSSRQLTTWIFRKDNRLFRVISLDDSLYSGSEFINRFYASLRPLDKKMGPSVFENKLDVFFGDFYSRDSLVNRRAKEAIPNVYFGPAGVTALLTAIHTLPYNGKDYLDTKAKLINELGYINDTTAIRRVVDGLKDIYTRAGDTSTFQNAVFKALTHLKTREAYDLLKALLVQDPPVFDNESDYNFLFRDLGDSLTLTRSLFPELMQLSTVDDYKENIQSLLASLVDSGYIKGSDYEPYFSQLYFDAKIQWKKQEGRDEKRSQKKEEEDGGDDILATGGGNTDNPLENFAILLAPFYDRNTTVPHFFDKLLQSRDVSLRLSTAILLLRQNRPVADSIIRTMASSDAWRGRLLRRLEDIHREKLFPGSYRTQTDIARSLLVAARGGVDFAEIQLVDKAPLQFREKKGIVYFFKYKITAEDDWQIGISGIQPVNPKEVSTKSEFISLTGKKIRTGTPVKAQFAEQLKRLLYSRRQSSEYFFLDGNSFRGRGGDDD